MRVTTAIVIFAVTALGVVAVSAEDESLFNTHYATLRTAPVGPLPIRDGGGQA